MIGQRNLLRKIEGQIERDKFPIVSILIGEKGSGRTTLVFHISRMMNLVVAPIPPDYETISSVYNSAYKVHSFEWIYLFQCCDRLSNKSIDIIKNMVNNPPDKSHIILTCESLNNIPLEIKSKAVTYMMESYSYEDKCDWLQTNEIDDLLEDQEEYILEVAANIGEMKEMCFMNIDGLRQSVREVLSTLESNENISKIVSDSKEDKYPLNIFWKAFMTACGDQIENTDNSLIYCRLIAITGDYLQELPYSKDTRGLFCSWVGDIGEEWNKFIT